MDYRLRIQRESWLQSLQQRTVWSYGEALLWVTYGDFEILTFWLADGPLEVPDFLLIERFQNTNWHTEGERCGFDFIAGNTHFVRSTAPTHDLKAALDASLVGAYGVREGALELIPAAEWPMLQLFASLDANVQTTASGIGLPWRQVVFSREDLLKQFPEIKSEPACITSEGLKLPTNGGETRAGRKLRQLADNARLSGDWPKAVDWKLAAQDEFSIGVRAADRVWSKVSQDFPELSSKSKPRRRRAK